ncbi:MAG TPA: DUF3592 domain-containing protein [Chloroflexia bacterium]|nr:DUF3592 domain-containing protein [Chloroflexia bacterium]
MQKSATLAYWLWFLARGAPFFLLLVFAPVLSILPELSRAMSSTGWPTTPGRVFAASVEQSRQDATRYSTNLGYSYEVAGTAYSGNTVFFGDADTSRAGVAAQVARYPVGGTVPVHYNPQNPLEAVLEPGFSWQRFPTLIWGLPLGVSLSLLLALLMVAFLAPTSRIGRRWNPLHRLPAESRRVRTEPVAPLIATWTARHAAGERPPEPALLLAYAYDYEGRAAESEHFAREALGVLDGPAGRPQARRVQLGGPFARQVAYQQRGMAHILLVNARLAQGAYSEAADLAQAALPTAPWPAQLWPLIAWAAFLSGDAARARAALQELRRIAPRERPQNLGVGYELVVAYLRNQLLGEDTRPALAQYQGQLAAWRERAGRRPAGPYRLRVEEVARDIERILATPA